MLIIIITKMRLLFQFILNTYILLVCWSCLCALNLRRMLFYSTNQTSQGKKRGKGEEEDCVLQRKPDNFGKKEGKGKRRHVAKDRFALDYFQFSFSNSRKRNTLQMSDIICLISSWLFSD